MSIQGSIHSILSSGASLMALAGIKSGMKKAMPGDAPSATVKAESEKKSDQTPADVNRQKADKQLGSEQRSIRENRARLNKTRLANIEKLKKFYTDLGEDLEDGEVDYGEK